MIVKEIQTKDYVTKSNLPFCDYVINPYVGCPHACKYCYASFMKRFTGHTEEWGSFLDMKRCEKPVSVSSPVFPSKAFAFEGFFFTPTVGGACIPRGSAPFPSDAPG